MIEFEQSCGIAAALGRSFLATFFGGHLRCCMRWYPWCKSCGNGSIMDCHGLILDRLGCIQLWPWIAWQWTHEAAASEVKREPFSKSGMWRPIKMLKHNCLRALAKTCPLLPPLNL